jgi:uncharacterized protein YpuA (DUF1002 family)
MSEVKEMILELKNELKENKDISEVIDDFANVRAIGTTDKEVILDVLSAVIFAICNTAEDYPEFKEFLDELEMDGLKKKLAEPKALS